MGINMALQVSQSEQYINQQAGAVSAINLGLERVAQVVAEMNLGKNLPIITVGGTNGKGSIGIMLSAILGQDGHKVGHYTSPHVLSFFERVCIGEQPAKDEVFLQSLQAVKSCAANVALTYFELTTLAAVHYFESQRCDIAVLEVGMGGRLDAVNAFVPMVAVISNVSLDHTEYLGDTREQIAIEKAGICRPDTAVIIGEKTPPATLLPAIKKIKAHPIQYGKDFRIEENLSNRSWHYHGTNRQLYNLNYPSLQGRHQLVNAACAVAALEQIEQVDKQWSPSTGAVRRGLHAASLLGRTQILAGQPAVLLDVGHNAGAAKVIDDFLLNMGLFTSTRLVLGMRLGKDFISFIDKLKGRIDQWYVGAIADGVCPQTIKTHLQGMGASVEKFSSITAAAKKAHEDSVDNDRIIVTGSFMTVMEYMQWKQTT